MKQGIISNHIHSLGGGAMASAIKQPFAIDTGAIMAAVGKVAAAARSAKRIVWGANCAWWDSIDKAGSFRTPSGSLPCCPHCRGVLYETDDLESWYRPVDEYDQKEPGYRAFIDWLRGRCFPGLTQARAAYAAEQAGGAA